MSVEDERHSIRSWGRRLGGEEEPLTRTEAQLVATMACADLLLEVRDAVQDMQTRLTRIELFLADSVPNYDQRTKYLAQKYVGVNHDEKLAGQSSVS